MKRGSFDLDGKVVYCGELPYINSAGRDILRALKIAINGLNKEYLANFNNISDNHCFLGKDSDGEILFFTNLQCTGRKLSVIAPSDVLGQAAIDAAMDGATIVFEGDELPDKNKVVYYDNGHVSSSFYSGGTVTNNVIAYKLLEEKESIEPQILSEKTGKHSHYFKDVSNLNTIDVYRICDLCEVDDKSGATQHAVKKLLCAGQRGAKDKRKDLEEARDTIIRKLQMMDEDGE